MKKTAKFRTIMFAILCMAGFSASAQLKVSTYGNVGIGTTAPQHKLDNFDYSVKKSITVSPASGDISVGNTDRITLMATDFVQIDRSFRVDLGGELTVMMQECLDNH